MAAIKSGVNIVLEDLVMDILTFLPVKSLLRLRCVCKCWCDLIANPDFITKHHLKQTTLNEKLGNFFLKYNDEEQQTPMISIVKDYNITQTLCLSFIPSAMPYILGPCNGLLCIVEDEGDNYDIWNPATRELKSITSENLADHLPDLCRSTYGDTGFGFDHKTNDYKVIQFVEHTFNAWRDEVKEVNIYSLRSESWRKIPPPLGGKVWPHGTGWNAYHDGVNYFWCYGETVEDQCVISFDMADEVFKKLPLIPNWIDLVFKVHFLVTMYNGSLSLILYHPLKGSDIFLDLWVMTEIDEGKDSWVKQISIGPISGIIYPVWILDKGEWIIVDAEGHLLLYDFKTKEQKKLFRLNWLNNTLQVSKYQESLVPIKGVCISQYYQG